MQDCLSLSPISFTMSGVSTLSGVPLTVTTDVQSASIVFYERTVSLNCTFADGSSARGCLFVLTLTNEEKTENVSISHTVGETSNTSCDQLSNTM